MGNQKEHSKTPIQEFLIRHAKKQPVSFHMPGHKGSALYKRFGYEEFLQYIMDCDITEIIGADNLFQAEGIIREVQENYAALYGVRNSYLLINGTSGGILASVLATVPKGGKLIMARNSHKAIFNALTLGDIQPVYAYPDLIVEYGISGAIRPEEIQSLLEQHPDAAAVILPSPNYYGICSDVKRIAEIVHRHGKILIVDQAHGAHLNLFRNFGIPDLPESAEEAGADLVISSIHKTLASFTQSALLNLNSDRVSPGIIEDKLQCIESTSPSYLLMASLDINATILRDHGPQLMKEWADNLQHFYREAAAIPGLDFIGPFPGMDWTKMNFSLRKLAISGAGLEEALLDYGIFIELYTGDLVMCMSGIGNTRHDMDRLLGALREIAGKAADHQAACDAACPKTSGDGGEAVAPIGARRTEVFELPRKKISVPLMEAEGMICASSIIPYPPGIPLVCPGEKLDRETLSYIKKLRESREKVIGVNSLGEITVGSL